MALIKCPECNHEISETAVTCPNCGYALQKIKNEQKKNDLVKVASKYKFVIVIATVLIVIIGLGMHKKLSESKLHIDNFMAEYRPDLSLWESTFGKSEFIDNGKTQRYIWNNCELIDGITGEMTLTMDFWDHEPDAMYGWHWDITGDEKILKKVQRLLKNNISNTENPRSYKDDLFHVEYKWIKISDIEYNTSWFYGKDEEYLKDGYHTIYLLQKDNSISIQYKPSNMYDGSIISSFGI